MIEIIETEKIKERLNYLNNLLGNRCLEYKIFGKTSEDARKDAKIVREIKKLEKILKKL